LRERVAQSHRRTAILVVARGAAAGHRWRERVRRARAPIFPPQAAVARRVVLDADARVLDIGIVAAPCSVLVLGARHARAADHAPARTDVEVELAAIAARGEYVLLERARVREACERLLVTRFEQPRPAAAEPPVPVERAVAGRVVEIGVFD